MHKFCPPVRFPYRLKRQLMALGITLASEVQEVLGSLLPPDSGSQGHMFHLCCVRLHTHGLVYTGVDQMLQVMRLFPKKSITEALQPSGTVQNLSSTVKSGTKSTPAWTMSTLPINLYSKTNLRRPMFPWGFRTLTMKFVLATFPVRTFQ